LNLDTQRCSTGGSVTSTKDGVRGQAPEDKTL
jgi:hypothetical protein